MKAIRLAAGAFLCVAFFASASMAQLQRTFVSGLGNDGNPCTRPAPCRTFGQAISQTNSSGEIYVLDSAGYAAFTINQPISIVAPPGVTAGISDFSGDGITINAGGSDVVILRGLTLNNQGSSGSGIVFNTGGLLHVESCVVNGFSNGMGVNFNGPGYLEVKDSIMRGNLGGIQVLSSVATARAAIDQVRLEANGTGLLARDGGRVTVRNSVASASTTVGFFGDSITSADTELNIENCVASNNGVGIEVMSTSSGVTTARMSNSTVTGNVVGLVNGGAPALILSRGNNTVEGNAANTSGTIGSYTSK